MKKVIILGLFQIGLILGWAMENEWIRTTAPSFRIPLRPVDPFDPVRGRYFILNPADRQLSTTSDSQLTTEEARQFITAADPKANDSYYSGRALVGLCPEEHLFRVCALRPAGSSSPEGHRAKYWVAALVNLSSYQSAGYRVDIDFKLDKFFLPNRIQLPGRENSAGWELEAVYREGKYLIPRRLYYRGEPVPTD